MLETRFERIPGDIGHPATFPFPVLHEVVPGASTTRVVAQQAAGLLDAFVVAGRRLVSRGAAGILTSCGFLALHQPALAAALPAPVATSSLLQLPLLERLLPAGRRAAVVTISAADLTPAHLLAVGAAPDTPVAGLPADGHFADVFLADRPGLDPGKALAELLATADRLLARHPATGAIVLECTNLGPYSAALARHTGLPVLDIVSLGRWLHQAVHASLHAPSRSSSGRACP